MEKIAGCVIADERGRYLLVQEKRADVYGKWNMLAGFVDGKEAPKAAAVRETKEEIGYDVVVDDEPFYTEENTEKDRYYYAFLGRIVGGDLVIQPRELLDAAWTDYERVEYLNDRDDLSDSWVFRAIKEAHENPRY